MKFTTILLLSIILAAGIGWACAQERQPEEATPASTPVEGTASSLIEQTVELPPFTKIELLGQLNVEVAIGETHGCRFVASPVLMPFLSAKVEGDTLKLQEMPHLAVAWVGTGKAIVSAAQIEAIAQLGQGDIRLAGKKKGPLSLTIAGMGDIQVFGHADHLAVRITGKGSVRAEHLNTDTAEVQVLGVGDVELADVSRSLAIEITGQANIEADYLQVKKLKVDLRGTGNVELSGKAEEAEIVVATSGLVRGVDLTARRARVTVMGTGTVYLRVVESLEATIYGSGDIVYFGEPRDLRTNIYGTGRITRGISGQ